jgi:hypothetical protein
VEDFCGQLVSAVSRAPFFGFRESLQTQAGSGIRKTFLAEGIPNFKRLLKLEL